MSEDKVFNYVQLTKYMEKNGWKNQDERWVMEKSIGKYGLIEWWNHGKDFVLLYVSAGQAEIMVPFGTTKARNHLLKIQHGKERT